MRRAQRFFWRSGGMKVSKAPHTKETVNCIQQHRCRQSNKATAALSLCPFKIIREEDIHYSYTRSKNSLGFPLVKALYYHPDSQSSWRDYC